MVGKPSPPWPDERLALLRRLEAQGLSIRQIGRQMGYAATTIGRQLKHLGLANNRSPRLDAPPRHHRRVRISKDASTLPPLASLRDES